MLGGEVLAAGAEPALSVAPRLVGDHRGEEGDDYRERGDGGDVRREGHEREKQRGHPQSLAVDRVHVAVAKGHQGKEVDRDPAEQGERRHGVERIGDVGKGRLHAEFGQHDSRDHQEVEVGSGVAGGSFRSALLEHRPARLRTPDQGSTSK